MTLRAILWRFDRRSSALVGILLGALLGVGTMAGVSAPPLWAAGEILDATATADITTQLPIDQRTQKPMVAKPVVDPEVIRRLIANFFKIYFKTALKIRKPTAVVPPPADAPGTEVGAVGAGIGAAVGKAAAQGAGAALQGAASGTAAVGAAARLGGGAQ